MQKVRLLGIRDSDNQTNDFPRFLYSVFLIYDVYTHKEKCPSCCSIESLLND